MPTMPTMRQVLWAITLHSGLSATRRARWLKRLPFVEPSPLLPRLIHQTISSRARITPLIADNIAALVRDNPDWSHRLYDAEERSRFIAEHYGREVHALYARIDPAYGAARADLFRYLLIYRLGGVYIDIKSSFTCPLSKVLRDDEKFVISHWDNDPDPARRTFGRHRELSRYGGREIQQWHVIAQAGHPFLRHVIARVLANIETYNARLDDVGRNGVVRTTGPIAYTHAIAPLLSRHPHRVIGSTADIGLDYSIAGYDGGAVLGTHYSRLTSPVVVRKILRGRDLSPATAVSAALDGSG